MNTPKEPTTDLSAGWYVLPEGRGYSHPLLLCSYTKQQMEDIIEAVK